MTVYLDAVPNYAAAAAGNDAADNINADDIEPATDDIDALMDDINATRDDIDAVMNDIDAVIDDINATTDDIDAAMNDIDAATYDNDAVADDTDAVPIDIIENGFAIDIYFTCRRISAVTGLISSSTVFTVTSLYRGSIRSDNCQRFV